MSADSRNVRTIYSEDPTMGLKGVVFSTSPTTKESADLFRRTADGMGKGARAAITRTGINAAGGAEATQFFTPTPDSPFAAVDGTPDFAVGILLPKYGTPIHMYISENSSGRDVQLVAKHDWASGQRADRIVRSFLGAFQNADAGLAISDGNV
jgi:hypothetical protein